MASAAKLSITLPAKQAATIRSAVKSGDYESAEDVVNSALKLWERQRAEETEYLRKAWKEGIESGTAPDEWNVEEFLKKARARKARAQQKTRRTAKSR
ncbi:MAG: type II toxin-antitoxin system ParD family antitoxin [Alphaproteobacteria bacterium]|nr:type II toxin-antitoxin system ParD family antitoxin [Alphaproteobacteria bacterium]